MATQYFVSLVGPDQINYLEKGTSNMHSGTASTATDQIELRIGNGTATAPTRFQVLKALDFFKKWLKDAGQVLDGTNLPLP